MILWCQAFSQLKSFRALLLSPCWPMMFFRDVGLCLSTHSNDSGSPPAFVLSSDREPRPFWLGDWDWLRSLAADAGDGAEVVVVEVDVLLEEPLSWVKWDFSFFGDGELVVVFLVSFSERKDSSFFADSALFSSSFSFSAFNVASCVDGFKIQNESIKKLI